MGMIRLAILNFKSGFKNYLSLVMSLAFTVLVFLDFQNILYSDAFEVLGTRNWDILCSGLLYGVFHLVFYQCFLDPQKEGDRNLCFHGTFQPENRKAVSD